MLLLLPEEEAPSGQIWDNIFSRYYYVSFTDKQYDFTLYAFSDTNALFQLAAAVFPLFACGAADTIYLIHLYRYGGIFITTKASFPTLSPLLTQLKAENSHRQPLKKETTPTALIAAELNDMFGKNQ